MDPSALRYESPPIGDDEKPWRLVARQHDEPEIEFRFVDSIEIGRADQSQDVRGKIFVPDNTISRRHCMITRQSDGRYYIRDFSSNGTRLDGRRLMPNVDTEVLPGQIIAVADGVEFEIDGETSRP